MADNDNPELLNLTFGADDNEFNAAIERMLEELNKLQVAAVGAAKDLASPELAAFVAKAEEISDALREPNAQISTMQSRIDGLAQSYSKLSPELQEITDEYKDLRAAQEAVAQPVQQVAPISVDNSDDGKSSSKGFGSSFAISRGLMAGGALARQSGSPELGGLLMGGGELLRVTDGLARFNSGLQAVEGGLTATTLATGALELAASPLVPVLVAIAAVVAVLAEVHREYNEQLKQGETFLKGQLDVNKQYNEAVHTMTTTQAEKAVEGAKADLRVANDNMGDLRNLIEHTKDALGLIGKARDDNSVRGRDEFKVLFEEYDKASQEVEKHSAYIKRMNDAIEQSNFIVQDNAEITRNATERKVRLATEEATFVNMSSDAAKKKIESLNQEINAAVAEQTVLKATGDESSATKERLEELRLTINNDRASVEQLNRVILPLIEAREREAQYVEYQKKQAEEIAGIQQKYNEQNKAIVDKEAQQEVEIHRKAADKVNDILEKEIAARQKSYEKLFDKERQLYEKFHEDDDKIARKNAFDDLQARQKEMVEERDALIEHQRNLQEIRDRFNGDEYQSLLDRDYIQLTKLKAQEQDAETAENNKAQNQKESHQQQLNDQRQFLAEQRAFERQERLIAYQNRVKEAIAEHERELEQARVMKETQLRLNAEAEQREITLAQQKRDAQIKILTDEYTASLRIAGMSRDARLLAEHQTQTALINQARQYMATMGEILNTGIPSGTYPSGSDFTGNYTRGPSIEQYAEGGDFDAYKPFTMSEPGNPESLSFGGQSYSIPGAALVYPLQSGAVTRDTQGGGKNITLAPTFIINEANNINQIRQELVDMLDGVIN